MEKYEVYARREDGEALTRVGTIEVEAGGSVEAAAKKEHGDDWLEMVAIPASKISWAIGEGQA
jgi:hypothetical protein